MPRGKKKPVERKWLEDELKLMGEDEGWDLEEPNLFQIWVMRLLHFSNSQSMSSDAFDVSFALLNEPETGPGDQALDGYFHDRDQNAVYLYQVKWPNRNNECDSKSADEVHLMLAALIADVRDDANMGTAREGAKIALREILDSKGTIVLRGISGTSWKRSESYAEAVRKKTSQLNLNDCEVKVELLGVDYLHHTLANMTNNLKGKSHRFKFYSHTTDPIMRFPTQGIEGYGSSIVGLISAESIAEAAKAFNIQLFDTNVRQFLGLGKVNKSIINAIYDETRRRAFWYGHNGITICCDDFEIIGPEDNPDEVKVHNPQIVNGCQTANSFKEVLTKSTDGAAILEEVGVLVRIIQVNADGDDASSITGSIAWATNNQSAIKESDLKANDPKQVKYADLLKRYDPPWFYERKTAEWKNFVKFKKSEAKKFQDPKNKERVVYREIYQQAWRAYSGHPVASITKKKEVWDTSTTAGEALYESVFAEDRRPCDIIFASALADWVAELFKFKRKDGTSEYSILPVARRAKIEHVNYQDTLGRAQGLVKQYTLFLFGELVKSSYGSLEQFDQATIDYLTTRMKRGTAHAKYRKTKEAKEVSDYLDSTLFAVFKVWRDVIDAVSEYKKPEDLDPDTYGPALRDWLKKEENQETVSMFLGREMEDGCKYLSPISSRST